MRPHAARHRVTPLLAAFLTVAALLPVDAACAQERSPQALAEHASVIVRGRVLRTSASDEPLLRAASNTAVITIQQMYAGAEIAGDQRGRTATVVLSRPGALKAGDEAFFFGNVRFLGRTMTIADDGELPAQRADTSFTRGLDAGLQARRDRPIADRIAAATLIFRGVVESVRPPEGGQGPATVRREPPTEHDPEWTAAQVRVVAPLRGGQAGQTVTVVFAASRDITWFNSPKLRAGQEALFLVHAPSREEETQLRATRLTGQSIYLVTEPYDVLPPADEGRLRTLLSR